MPGSCGLSGPGRRVHGGDAGQDGLLHRLGEVLPQVEPVGDLHRGGRRLPGGPGVGAAPVPADHLDAGMGAQPVREGLRLPVRQHVNKAVAVHIHQHGRVRMALALGDIIDAQHGDRPGLGIRQRPDQPDQGEPGHGRARRGGQPGTRPARQRQRDLLQQAPQLGGAPLVPAGQPGNLLSKRGHRARRIAAAEPAGLQHHLHRPPAAGKISQPAAVPVVHPGRDHPAAPAGQQHRPGSRRDLHPAAQVFDVNKVQARQVREQHRQQAGFPASEFVQHN